MEEKPLRRDVTESSIYSADYPAAPRVSVPIADRSTVELLSSLLADGRVLIRKEIEAARLELEAEAKRLKKAAMATAAAGFLLLLGSLMLSMALGFGLAAAGDMGEWAGFIIVGGVFAILGFAFLLYGRSRSHEANIVPTESAREFRQDIKWLKESTSSGMS